MPKPNVLISLRATLLTESKEFGRSFMQALLNEDIRLEPELVSLSERFKDPYVHLENFLEKWWAVHAKMYSDGRYSGESYWGPTWRRRSNIASRGMINHGLVNIDHERTASTLWFESRWDNEIKFEALFSRWVALAKPNVGMLHMFTERELCSIRGGLSSAFAVGTFGGPAKPGIPDAGWAMAYGNGYAQDVDVDLLRHAGFLVEIIEDVIVVKITEKLSDVLDDYEHFNSRRDELKKLFRPGFFRDKNDPSGDWS